MNQSIGNSLNAAPPDLAPANTAGPDFRPHALSRSTVTSELRQLQELNTELAAATDVGRRITAAELALAALGEALGGGSRTAARSIPAEAVLTRIAAFGPPDFPYVSGHFAAGAASAAPLVAELHTSNLRMLSQLFGLHHNWGAGLERRPEE